MSEEILPSTSANSAISYITAEATSSPASGSTPSPESGSTSSSTPIKASIPTVSPGTNQPSYKWPPYTYSRDTDKRHRKPLSIFDLPSPPKSAPPQDTKSFFDRLDAIEKSWEEEDAGDIPATLKDGPEIIVESLNKKKFPVEENPYVSPSLSPQQPISSTTVTKKKVHFDDSPQIKMIEARPDPPIRRSTRIRSRVDEEAKSKPYTYRRNHGTYHDPMIFTPAWLDGTNKPTLSQEILDILAAGRQRQGVETNASLLGKRGSLDMAEDIADRSSATSEKRPRIANNEGNGESSSNDPELAVERGTVFSEEENIDRAREKTASSLGKRRSLETSEDVADRSSAASEKRPRIVNNEGNGESSSSNPEPEVERNTTLYIEEDSDEVSNVAHGHLKDNLDPDHGSDTVVIQPPPSILKRGRPKKSDDNITSVASLIGSRRKQSVGSKVVSPQERVIARSKNGLENIQSSKKRSRETFPVIDLDNDDVSEQIEIRLEPSTSMTSKAKNMEALSGAKLYVIPSNMDSRVFEVTRNRVLSLGGSWLGPKVKPLSTDPRSQPEVPALDQENTTHIVTTLSSVEAVKRVLKVDTINTNIHIVSREWLTDCIMYKKVMDSQGYRLQQTESIVKPQSHNDERDETPPLNPSNKSQDEFNDIVQGLQEGSLDDADISDGDGDISDIVVVGDKVDGGNDRVISDGLEDMDTHNDEGASSNSSRNIASVDSPAKSSNERLEELTEEMKSQLRHENRCFKCKEVGHWANRCPHTKRDEKDGQVLLQIINSGKSEGKRRKILYQCESPHAGDKKDEPKYNKAIIEQLKILMNHYDTIKTKGSKEHFKVINYRKAITVIRSLDYEITSEEMALKVPRVGKKIAQKIGECVAFGKIKKLDYLDIDKGRSDVETLFRSVYGVGSEKATEWYNRGLRTLDELRELPELTKNQISGLKYHENLMKRIPRAEVEEIGRVVDSAAKQLHLDIQSMVTGSYRRGKEDCGDIDIVVARPNIDDGAALYDIMEHILAELSKNGLLVDHLSWPVWSDEMADKPKHFKYMGICKLAGEDKTHRHIDILVVPWVHHGAVLLYFTGNDICNRSMRLFASKRGMHLSDKGLFDGIIRGPKRERLNEGRWVAGRTEREIFDYLGINFLEPYEREC